MNMDAERKSPSPPQGARDLRQPSPFEGEGVREASPAAPTEGLQEPNRPVGEVVQASTAEFAAQCHRLYDAPPLGALVRSGGDSPVYGIVAEVSTQSIEPGRRPMAMAEENDTVEAAYERNPQLGRLLSTEFRSIVAGHRSDGALRRYLAPLPPRIHTPVFLCNKAELLEFTRSLDFLSILVASPVGSQDDVTAAFLRTAGGAHPDPNSFLIEAGKEVATLLAGDGRRLNAVLRRLSL